MTNWIVGIALAALVAAGAAVFAVNGIERESSAVQGTCLAAAGGEDCLGEGTCDGACEELDGTCLHNQEECATGEGCQKSLRGNGGEGGKGLGGDCGGDGSGNGRCRGSAS